jgi:DNA-binding MarR family transcriptional regulator
VRSADETEAQRVSPRLGRALSRAWVGYQRRLDQAMAAAGFDDRGFPDARVLRMCRDDPDTTISRIGRELGITRQGAGKIVASLRDRGYVSVHPSPSSGREKTVTLTSRAHHYLAAHRDAALAIEDQLCRSLGTAGFDALSRLLEVLGAREEDRLRDYLRQKGAREL